MIKSIHHDKNLQRVLNNTLSVFDQKLCCLIEMESITWNWFCRDKFVLKRSSIEYIFIKIKCCIFLIIPVSCHWKTPAESYVKRIFLKKFFSKKLQKPLRPNSKSMQAFLLTIPYHYQTNGDAVPPGESQVMYDKEWGYVLGIEHQTLRQALTSIDVILQVPFNNLEAKSKEKK